MAKPATVDDYCAALTEPAAALLHELRALCRSELPDATEALKWGQPALVHPDGVILLMLSAYRHFASVTFTPSTREAFAAELTDYETGKGSVKLPYGTPPPEGLLRRMIVHRLDEFERGGVRWM